jgi:arylsulfatase A-like enzyme/Tfp pilus assembly protein PilF
MKSRKFLVLAAAGIVIAGAVAAYVLFFPRVADFASLRNGRDFNVIVITLDTARADALACYGRKGIETPTIDGFAARGIRFDKCYAQTPLTLPSHVTLMTGTLPLFHGVRDNGGFLTPLKLVTMAELFKDKGYETGAFIGAWVLDSRWGLNQGFDTYFDDFDLSKFRTISFETVQRPANEVMDAALPWLEARKDKRFFTWIHLYDPHSPYEPPPPFNTQYAAQPYLGEVAFADSELHRLWQFLETNGFLKNSLIVFAGDHGESLGEHKEQTHGFFIYQAAIHIPLIIVTPFSKLRRVVSSEVTGLVDVLPTVCEMAGLPVPVDVQGESLVPAFFGRRRAKTALAYSETYYPLLHYGWSDLKSVQDGRYKLILAPVPELYDVVSDPREETNLVYREQSVYKEMSAAAEALIQASSRNAYEADPSKIDAETREKLSALGYIASFTDPAKLRGKRLADPKDRIAVFNDLARAREAGVNGNPDEAIRIVQGIISTEPDTSAAAYEILGASYIAKNELGRAEENLRKALELDPQLSNVHYKLAWIAEKLGRLPEAEAEYVKELEILPHHFQALYNLARVYDRTRNLGKEQEVLKRCLEADPKFPLTYLFLARLYLNRGERYAEAIDLVQKGIDLKPEPSMLPTAYLLLADLYGRVGDEARSRECAEKGRALAGALNKSK